MTDKQAAFVREYVKDFNATQAAIRAGYAPDSARQQASENLSKHDIQEAITQFRAEAESAAVATLREALETATEWMRNEELSVRERLAAMERLAKFNGWDAPEKRQEVGGGIVVNVVPAETPEKPPPPCGET